jgi:hypothetical protein
MSAERSVRDADAYCAPSIEERTPIDAPLIGNGGSGFIPCAVIK